MALKLVTINSKSYNPSKLVCIGRNYVEHIHELNNEVPEQMIVFMKPNSAISETLRSSRDEPINYEAEICLMVKQGRIHAIAAGLDLTKRDVQDQLKSKGLPWERAKAFDGAALFSNFVEIDAIPSSLTIELEINEEMVQRGSVELMLHKPQQILAECKTFLSFNDGDIIMTGTPRGVGIVRAGDRYNAKITNQGEVLTEASWVAE